MLVHSVVHGSFNISVSHMRHMQQKETLQWTCHRQEHNINRVADVSRCCAFNSKGLGIILKGISIDNRQKESKYDIFEWPQSTKRTKQDVVHLLY